MPKPIDVLHGQREIAEGDVEGVGGVEEEKVKVLRKETKECKEMVNLASRLQMFICDFSLLFFFFVLQTIFIIKC